MLTTLLQRFVRDQQGAYAVMMTLFLPMFTLFIFVSYEFGRFYMTNSALSSATQQTVEWMANRGSAPGEDPNALTLNALQQRLPASMFNVAGQAGITTSFSYDGTTNISRLVTKYTHTLNLGGLIDPVGIPIYSEARIKLNPVFFSIVFSSGEMRSEGNAIYGRGQTGANSYNRGVSWTNPYYTNVINQPVTTRTTPTHNFYMVTALVKELNTKFSYRKRYINIIPVSATINLNPQDYSASPTGTKEGKLPPWIYNDNGLRIDNTKNAINNSSYCITNRSFPIGDTYLNFQQDYYRIVPSEIGTSIPIYTYNTFTHDQLLMDSSFSFKLENTHADIYGNQDALRPRGYPYSSLSGGRCPAINTTPALATFHEITTNDYTPDSTSKIMPTENENFWDYMRNYIDPAKVNSYAIWGSPNISFGLQIAYENIAYVQKSKKINNNGSDFDPSSDFFVYVVSDQIGGVKNAGGANYVLSPTDLTRWANRNQCISNLYTSYTLCYNVDLGDVNTNPAGQLPSNNGSGETTVNFQFTHFWWDNAYNPANFGCMGYGINIPNSCDIVWTDPMR